jgi:Holliday junction resolvase RusA-like endonuclease
VHLLLGGQEDFWEEAMGKATLTIPGVLPNLNDYTTANRNNRYSGAKMKHQTEDLIIKCAKAQLRGVKFTKPVHISYLWVEKNRKRDLDNICGFGMKVIQDGLVKAGYLPDDGWNFITGFDHKFKTDAKNPRIEVTIIEEENLN